MTILDSPDLGVRRRHLPAGTYPINVDLNGRPCLVVGAGAVAARKATGLLAAGAAVTLVAPEISAATQALIDEHAALGHTAGRTIAVHQRPYRRGEAASYRLVITATDDQTVNERVFLDCEAAGVWCNSADDLDNCSFILPAVVRRDQVLVTVSSTGRSPAVASWLKRRIDDVLSPHIGRLVEVVADTRTHIRRRYGTTEAVDWATTLDLHGGHLLDLVAAGEDDAARELLLNDLRPVTAETSAAGSGEGAARSGSEVRS